MEINASIDFKNIKYHVIGKYINEPLRGNPVFLADEILYDGTNIIEVFRSLNYLIIIEYEVLKMIDTKSLKYD